MVIPIGYLKDKKCNYIRKEIKDVADVCHKHKVELRVILETCELSVDEIKLGCELAGQGGANYVMTSTGFLRGGANVDIIKVMKEIGNKYGMKVKASGGIRTADDAIRLLDAGAYLFFSLEISLFNIEMIVLEQAQVFVLYQVMVKKNNSYIIFLKLNHIITT